MLNSNIFQFFWWGKGNKTFTSTYSFSNMLNSFLTLFLFFKMPVNLLHLFIQTNTGEDTVIVCVDMNDISNTSCCKLFNVFKRSG